MQNHVAAAWLIFSSMVAFSSSAHEPHDNKVAAPAQAPEVVSVVAPVGMPDPTAAAAGAVAVVEAFTSAIKAVKLDEAAKLLDEHVVILESGGSERSRAEYLGGHAVADAAFMQNIVQSLRFRKATAEGTMAWVASESLLQTVGEAKPTSTLSTETMVLKLTDQGWRIVHIHWSSRPAPSP